MPSGHPGPQGRIATTRYGVNHRISLDEVERFRAWYIHDTIQSNADDMLADLFGDQASNQCSPGTIHLVK